MMAQDLILKLQALVDKHGDLDTTVYPGCYDVEKVELDTEDGWINIILGD